jgi:hypothetical protein
MSRLTVSLFTFIALSGCTSAQTPIERPATTETVRIVGSGAGDIAVRMAAATEAHSTTISAPVSDVWPVMSAVYDSFGIPIGKLDQQGHVIGNEGFNLRRRLGSVPLARLIDCGNTQGGPSAENYDIRLSVLTLVRPGEAGSTTIATAIDAMGRPMAFSGEYVRCSSTGVLESRIADAVKAQLRK